ncbi:TRAP transporter substrate-binding protein [Fulvimarina sp. 2208YS6-2-32]|uniref:TRAP transporter substrate-binding protein n=1 Tax=Fulvimarina uroteuthidis TaxID=3098149 RepID=A0ABU5I4C8_9HYPH|nr:TRAP transporter substrate-binding protein [Fulvimarina sp. 2208YS6-2-32]MDY8109788.1 TRAP transporter substrate-binding protein [Fulvimarina sp. 2208YS6-2-32]
MTETNTKSVDRRSFLKKGVIGGGAIAASTLAAPAVLAQAPLTIKMQTSWPASDIWQTMAQQYADRVEAMSGGRLKVDLLPAGAVVGAFQVIDAVSDGVLDVSHSVSAYWYGKNKAASLFGTGPVFGGNPTTMMAWFYEGGGQEFFRELTQDNMGLNVIGMLGFPMPPQPFGWFTNPVESVENIKGLKYRTVGLAADLMQSMGMSVTQLPGGEIVPAMERGVIDAFEFNNPSSDRRFGAQDVAKNYYLGSYHQASEAFEFLFNRDFMEDLDDDLRAIVEHAVEASSTKNTTFALENYSSDLAKLRDEDGVNILETPPAILDAQLEAWSAMIPQLEEDPFIKKVLDSQRSFVERVTYYELVNTPSYRKAYEHFFPGKLPTQS